MKAIVIWKRPLQKKRYSASREIDNQTAVMTNVSAEVSTRTGESFAKEEVDIIDKNN